MESKELIEDLMEFENNSKEEIVNTFLNEKELNKKEMKKYDLTDPAQYVDYKVNNNYEIYHHLKETPQHKKQDKLILEEIKKNFPNKQIDIIDIGSNAGRIARILSKEKYLITVADPNKKANEFISFRFTKHKLRIKRLPRPIHPKFKNKYDLVLCFGVFNNLPEEKHKEVINLIIKLMNPDGRFLCEKKYKDKIGRFI